MKLCSIVLALAAGALAASTAPEDSASPDALSWYKRDSAVVDDIQGSASTDALSWYKRDSAAADSSQDAASTDALSWYKRHPDVADN
ncbi:hypothetical protein Daus18300_006316 [Diaporthe australafricana]|uniref:Uncharacterized protein n=1 Tax=Diaporthe australafricana TaxID=127596 RepID=A0ABR3WVJ1_9PEZI